MMHFIDVESKNDTRRATYYLTNASHGGCSNAKALLNYINKEDTDKAAISKQLFEWHIDNQHADRPIIMYIIGWMYYEGFGTDQDYLEALYYIKISADPCHPVAELLIGFLYAKGHGTDQGWTKVIKWYIKSANQKDIEAVCNLGRIFKLKIN